MNSGQQKCTCHPPPCSPTFCQPQLRHLTHTSTLPLIPLSHPSLHLLSPPLGHAASPQPPSPLKPAPLSVPTDAPFPTRNPHPPGRAHVIEEGVIQVPDHPGLGPIVVGSAAPPGVAASSYHAVKVTWIYRRDEGDRPWREQLQQAAMRAIQ